MREAPLDNHYRECSITQSLLTHCTFTDAGFLKNKAFNFPIFSMNRTRKGGRVIPKYPNLTLG